jgi:D-sedoheptulose 7-phosphate isomerase
MNGGRKLNGSNNATAGRERSRVQVPSQGARDYFMMHYEILDSLPYEQIEEMTHQLWQACHQGRTVFSFGNGGSAALASHFACDLGKGTLIGLNGSKRFRVIALTDNLPLITAWANDTSYDDVFAEQLRSLAIVGDVALAISGSGNSGNVLRALEVARSSGCTTMGITGYSGGKMKALCDYCVVVPSDNMQIIEDFHLSVCHALFTSICRRISESPKVISASASVAHGD